VLAELTSAAPADQKTVREFISDEFKLPSQRTADLLERSETIGFVDSEGKDTDKLYFNGNLFRRENIAKAKKVLDSLSTTDATKVSELDQTLDTKGCVAIAEAEQILGDGLFSKLKSAGMYDLSHVTNPNGEFGFVTKPSAFHKFNDPLVDDAFDLAKALVSALSYGMTQSVPGRGRIMALGALLRKLITGIRSVPRRRLEKTTKSSS